MKTVQLQSADGALVLDYSVGSITCSNCGDVHAFARPPEEEIYRLPQVFLDHATAHSATCTGGGK